jgi:hypothetical protein
MLEPVRAFAESHLYRKGAYRGTRDRHAAFFVTWVACATAGLGGIDERAWAARLADELDNLRHAYRWLLDTGQNEPLVRLLGACYPWAFAGAPAEVTDWASEASSSPTPASPATPRPPTRRGVRHRRGRRMAARKRRRSDQIGVTGR